MTALLDLRLDTIVTLPRSACPLAIASECREAALMFLNESDDWGKGQLATWLLGPYATATRWARPQSATSGAFTATELPLMTGIDITSVEHVLSLARAEVREVLENLFEADGAERFAERIFVNRLVDRSEDGLGNVAWVPTRATRRLADRVLSLIAADYLFCPADYELDLAVCPLCRSVIFDGTAKLRGACARHQGHSASSGGWHGREITTRARTDTPLALTDSLLAVARPTYPCLPHVA